MYKINRFFIFLVFIAITSCSTNEDDTANTSPDPNVEETPSNLKIDVNGVEYYNSDLQVLKTESKISFSGCEFDTYGQLAYLSISVPTGNSSGTMRTFSSFKYFNSNYFTFNLESVDEINKRVKGNFAGYLYANPTDLNSEKKFVSGSFNLKYRDLVPGVFGLKNRAKINGNEWVKVYRESSNTEQTFTQRIIHQDYSSDEYKITIDYQVPYYISSFPATTYNFNPTDVSNNVRIAKYDVTTGSLINYNTTGTFSITKFENYIIRGNYSFTAVNPNNPSDIIQVTDGEVKMIHNYF